MSRVDIDAANIVEGRRERRATKTYWSQYVIEDDPTVRGYDPSRATLKWLLSEKGYFADVPPEEVAAAIEDSDFSASSDGEAEAEDGSGSDYSSTWSESEEELHVPRPPQGVGGGKGEDGPRPVVSEY